MALPGGWDQRVVSQPLRRAAARRPGWARGRRTLASYAPAAAVDHAGHHPVACAFDHVIESFPDGLTPATRPARALTPTCSPSSGCRRGGFCAGAVVWPMVEFEADDALSSATARFTHDAAVEHIVICSPDKDLAQQVSGNRIVGWDRRRNFLSMKRAWWRNLAWARVDPRLAGAGGRCGRRLPRHPGLGCKVRGGRAGKIRALSAIPADPHTWGLSAIAASRAARLAASLTQHRTEALLFRSLATLREDVPLQETLADLEWLGAYERLKEVCHRLGDDKFPGRCSAVAHELNAAAPGPPKSWFWWVDTTINYAMIANISPSVR